MSAEVECLARRIRRHLGAVAKLMRKEYIVPKAIRKSNYFGCGLCPTGATMGV